MLIMLILEDHMKKLQVPLLGCRTLCLWRWSGIINSFLKPLREFLCSFPLPITLRKPHYYLPVTFFYVQWCVSRVPDLHLTEISGALDYLKRNSDFFSFLTLWVLKCVWVRRDIGLSLLYSSCLLWSSFAPLTTSDLSSAECWMSKMTELDNTPRCTRFQVIRKK